MKKYPIYTFLIFLLLTVQFAQAQESGIVKIDALVSSALGNNVTKEDTTRPLAIYLPRRVIPIRLNAIRCFIYCTESATTI